jgi:hypothetical protein
MDPYDVLGLPKTASFEQIRARYKQLAKQHHPDKWSRIDSNSDEFRYHEEEFKKITVAYHLLEQGKVHGDFGGGGENDASTKPRSKEDWNAVWKKMEDLLAKKNIMGHLSNLFKATLEEVGKNTITQHHFTVPVTLEEITAKKKKKIRLFLKDDPEPFYVTFSCDNYPKYETTVIKKGMILQVTLHLNALPHELYEVDEIIEGELDLFRTLRMTLWDYFNGKLFQWTHLDGRVIDIEIPPLCGKAQGFLWTKMEGYGLLGKGSLFITLEWNLPSQNDWINLTLQEQEIFLNSLNKLYKN